MSKNSELHLPAAYEAQMGDAEYSAFDKLIAPSAAYYADEMPEPQAYHGNLMWDARYVLLRNPEDTDPAATLVVPFPFGNGYTPGQHIRMRAIQLFADAPVDIVALPNNDANEEYQSRFADSELLHTGGDAIAALARRGIAIAHSLKRQNIGVVGDSQGASVGASMLASPEAHDLDIQIGASLAEAVDVHRRLPGALWLRFAMSGGNLDQAVSDSGVPALLEGQGVNILEVLQGSVATNNYKLHQSMRGDKLVDRVIRAHEQGHWVEGSTLTYMDKSRLVTKRLAETVGKKLQANGIAPPEIVEDYGHEGMDNVVLRALMARNAITPGLERLSK